MRFALLLLLVLLSARAWGGTLTLTPAVVPNGGAALLRWEGERPSLAVARFNGEIVFLRPTALGSQALLGVDLEAAPGEYPLVVAIADSRGKTEVRRLALQVESAQLPEERLFLPPAQVSPRNPQVVERIARERQMLSDLFALQDTPAIWEGFSLPVTDPLSSPFGLRRILNGKPRSPHSGVDFRSPRGTPVRAPSRGRTVLASDLFYTGRTVILDHGAGLFSLYGHLETVLCEPGQLLEGGQALGLVGSSGRSTGPHLHWGIKLRGNRIDPMALVDLFAGENP
ncbi:MAG: M23 family peptidase [Desulfuromonas sp.]|uniref:M23 family metallopeptidase n=1 Tax=Desulfuromonas sp. TaxID=892 RepID=UPI000CBD88D9|nr:M23 family metallopeptidase [Desulfuromonas sp.]PLX83112.1 MAG: M23 family peptidase [Desulfuromonas sp.]